MNRYVVGNQVTLRLRVGVNPTQMAQSIASGGTVLPVRDSSGYQATEGVTINPGAIHGTEEFHSVAGTAAGTITVTSTLRYAHNAPERVMELAPPSPLTLTVQPPSGTAFIYSLAGTPSGTIQTTAAGRYYLVFPTAIHGIHEYRWAGTNPDGAAQGRFDVVEDNTI